MAIKLNGVEITSNKLNNQDVTLENLDGVKVWPTAVIENYVRFVSASSRTITPKYTNSGVTLQYSVDSGATWTTITSESETTSATEHWFRGQATGTKSLFTSGSTTNAWAFSGSSDLEVYGNLNFLLCDTLGDEVAPTSLGDYCYYNMFRGRISLTVAPELPATTLRDYCYYGMFYGCTSLTTAPELPVTTLADNCYNAMFNGCTSLTTAPELPATILGIRCYYSMFNGCSSFKVSETNTGSYTYSWRIPTSGTGTEASNWNGYMLTSTGGTFTSNPTIDTTYWVVNKPVSTDDTNVTLQWQFVMSYSSEPAIEDYDVRFYAYINGDYEQGLSYLDINYQEDLHEGFVAVISDQSTLDFFEYVVVAI